MAAKKKHSNAASKARKKRGAAVASRAAAAAATSTSEADLTRSLLPPQNGDINATDSECKFSPSSSPSSEGLKCLEDLELAEEQEKKEIHTLDPSSPKDEEDLTSQQKAAVTSSYTRPALGFQQYYNKNNNHFTTSREEEETLSSARTEEMVFGPIPDRAYHEGFMRKAIEMAELALRSDETPVGCVFVHEGKVIGRGINGTNATLNGTRHAEFVALCEILSTYPQAILRQTDLYVTVEPCIMCASALRQYGIRAVYFGCLNDRFGGTGGVMTVNADEGVDRPFPVYGGLFREEAIMLLRRFYVQENEKAPEPKPKKNRELKTEILPAHVPPSKGANALTAKTLAQAAAPVPPVPKG